MGKEWQETGKETFRFWIKKYGDTLCGWPSINCGHCICDIAKCFTSERRTQQASQIQRGGYREIETYTSFPPSQQPPPVHRPKASRIQFTSRRHSSYMSTATFILSSLQQLASLPTRFPSLFRSALTDQTISIRRRAQYNIPIISRLPAWWRNKEQHFIWRLPK